MDGFHINHNSKHEIVQTITLRRRRDYKLFARKYFCFSANHHLRQSLVFLDMPTLQQPDTAKFLGGFLKAFDEFEQKNL